MILPQNQLLVIFGASGDLTFRKLIPAVFDLYVQKLLPKHFAILGLGRTTLSDSDFRVKMLEGVRQFASFKHKEELMDEFAEKLCYYAFDTLAEADYKG
jgi:glucose-6-phosphate 1-dehydrogenase